MKAAVLREVNQPVVVEDVQVDAPAPREVLVRTGASGVCHSDLHFVRGPLHHAHALHPRTRGRRHRGSRGRTGQLRPPGRLGDLVPVGILRDL